MVYIGISAVAEKLVKKKIIILQRYYLKIFKKSLSTVIALI